MCRLTYWNRTDSLGSTQLIGNLLPILFLFGSNLENICKLSLIVSINFCSWRILLYLRKKSIHLHKKHMMGTKFPLVYIRICINNRNLKEPSWQRSRNLYRSITKDKVNTLPHRYHFEHINIFELSIHTLSLKECTFLSHYIMCRQIYLSISHNLTAHMEHNRFHYNICQFISKLSCYHGEKQILLNLASQIQKQV
jgi:hypothetical protein